MTTKQRLIESFIKYDSRKWYRTAIRSVLTDLLDFFAAKSEVRAGGVVSAGASVTASALQTDTTALDCTLGGLLKLQLGAQNDLDLFTTSGAAGRATYANGATAAAISLATDETAYVTVVACDSDGAGAATGDNGAVILVALVAGTSTTYAAKTAFLTDSEIDDALAAATGVHDGVTGWVRLADILWDENSGSPTATITVNRDS